MENFGLKELYEVVLKTNFPIKIGNREIAANEVVCAFDRINISGFEENKNFVSANGGYDNRSHVWWEETKDVSVVFSQGIFSKTHFALMNNAKLLSSLEDEVIEVDKREVIETDENSIAVLARVPSGEVFVYNKNTGEKVTDYRLEDNRLIFDSAPFMDFVVDYQFVYSDGYEKLSIGQTLVSGYLTLSGKTRTKDESTGKVKTGIIKIPKLKITSQLQLRLGSDASPLVGTFRGVAVPVGDRENKHVLDIYFLEDEIEENF